MNATPLELEELSPLRVTLGKLLASKQTEFHATWQEQSLAICIALEQAENLPAWQLGLEVNGQPLEVYVSHKLLDHLLPGKLDHNAVTRLPEELTLAALTFALSPMLETFSHNLGVSILLTDFDSSDVSMMKPTLGLDVAIGGINTQVQLELNDLLLSIINTLPTHQTAQLPDIPFRTCLELGRTRLTGAELGDLETGDVVFLDEHVSGQQLIVRVNPRVAFLAEASGTQVTIKQRLQAMADEATDNQAAGVDLDDLNVELTFEVGQQQMTAAELQGLQPGYVFDLERPIEQPVKIRANGKLIAECTLVQIDSRLGARITRLADSQE